MGSVGMRRVGTVVQALSFGAKSSEALKAETSEVLQVEASEGTGRMVEARLINYYL